jgi:translation initiation factor 5A
MSEHEEQFESAESGASFTYPMQAGNIRKGGYIVIKDRPCKVIDVSTSKTGKHGHAKCHFVAQDLFTNKRLEDLTPSSHNCEVPHVTKDEYSLLDISDDGFITLMDDSGNDKSDLRLPNDDVLCGLIETGFAEDKQLVITVLKSMGEEMVFAVKEQKSV